MNNYYKFYSLFVLLCLGCWLLQAVETPEERFLQAAYQNDIATVKKSIEQEHVDVNVKRYASYHLGYYKDKKLIFAGATNFDDFDYFFPGSAALHYAAEAGSTAVVKYLLTVPGIDIDCVLNGTSALYRAIIHNNFDSAYELLKAGADYTRFASNSSSAARYVLLSKTSYKAQRIVQLIDTLDAYKQQLYTALESNNEHAVKLLLQKIPHGIKDQNGNTLLHQAAKSCDTKLVALILTLDMQAITKYNKYGQTPVDVAVAHSRLDTVELFAKFAYAEPVPINYSEDPCTVPLTCTIV